MEILKYGIGIDIAKDKFDACISQIDERQHVKVKAQRNFSNNPHGFETFLSWTIKNIKGGSYFVFLMEATGIYYEHLAWFLHNKDRNVSVVLPNKAKKYKQALGLKSKNDRIDAKGLARMCCEQNHTEWKPLTKNIYILRLLTRRIQSFSEQVTVFKNQLHALEHGMYRDRAVEKMYLKQIASLERNKKSIERKVEELIHRDELLERKFANICKMTGLGIQSLAVIVAETNGFTTFQNIAQVVSYAGYDVVENQSGNRSGKTRISKKGNSHIRRSLFFPAFNVVKYKMAPFKDLYERIFERSKIKMKAYTAVQKKILEIIFVLWKKDDTFDPNYQGKISGDSEPELSFSSIPKESDKPAKQEQKQSKTKVEKITPTKARVTQDKHPLNHHRLPSFS